MNNFIQIGEGHCWICHKTYYQNHICTLETVFATPCNPLTCGRWYQEREKMENNLSINHMSEQQNKGIEDTSPLTMEERLKSEFEKAYWSDDYPDLEDLVNRPDNISNWWLSKISSAVSWALKEQREEMIKNIKNISWEDMKCDCNMCYAHEKAINSVLSLLSNNKE